MKLKYKKGYSLIELIIYIALLGIFLYSLTNLFISSIDLRLETEANSSVEQDGRFILNRLRYDITQSTAIVVPATLGVPDDTLTLSRGGTNYTYSVVGGNFEVTNGVNTDQLNSTRTTIPSISFLRLGNVGGKNTITVSFTVNSETVQTQGVKSRSYEVTFGIR